MPNTTSGPKDVAIGLLEAELAAARQVNAQNVRELEFHKQLHRELTDHQSIMDRMRDVDEANIIQRLTEARST